MYGLVVIRSVPANLLSSFTVCGGKCMSLAISFFLSFLTILAQYITYIQNFKIKNIIAYIENISTLAKQMTENLTYHERLRLIKLGQLPKEAVPKKKKYLNKVSPKKQAQQTQDKLMGVDGAQDLWFEERRKECVGRCALCGEKTEKANDETYRRSIHHLLDKRKTMFPSVATHPDNWLEVCFWSNSCHTNLHNGTITWELLFDSKEWKIIKEKLDRVIPCVSQEEIKRLPPLLYKLYFGEK